MVTLVLIGIVAGFATLALPGHGPGEQLAGEARRLRALIELNHHEAVLLGESRGVRFSNRGYEFLALDRGGLWEPVVDSDLLQRRRLPEELELRLEVEGAPVDLDATPLEPQIVLQASGEATDFAARLETRESRGYTVTGDVLGNLRTEPGP
jgi:general secretion pathway protein H